MHNLQRKRLYSENRDHWHGIHARVGVPGGGAPRPPPEGRRGYGVLRTSGDMALFDHFFGQWKLPTAPFCEPSLASWDAPSLATEMISKRYAAEKVSRRVHPSLQPSPRCPNQPTVIVPHSHWEAYGRGSLPLHHLVPDSAQPHCMI